jgi:hypothetical protein
VESRGPSRLPLGREAVAGPATATKQRFLRFLFFFFSPPPFPLSPFRKLPSSKCFKKKKKKKNKRKENIRASSFSRLLLTLVFGEQAPKSHKFPRKPTSLTAARENVGGKVEVGVSLNGKHQRGI